MRYCRLTYRVPFSETDAMGIVHHSNHARYLERGRIELLRLVDLNYNEVMKQGFHIPLTDLQVSFKKPLAFDDVILIETSVGEVTKTRMKFTYRIFAGCDLAPSSLNDSPFPGSPAVTGETAHCCVNEKGRPVPMTEAMFQKFSELRAL